MRVHLWFEGMFVLLLHGAAILNTAYDKCGVNQYVRWLIFMHKIIPTKVNSSLISHWGEGVGLWETSQWRFPLQNQYTSGS